MTEFSPHNQIVKQCLQGMSLEAKGQTEAAGQLFLQAWNEAQYDFEKFISAYYLAGLQQTASDQLKWLDTTLQVALKINDDSVNSALPLLYTRIAACHADLNKPEQAQKYQDLAASIKTSPSSTGPFYHGTKADLKAGDLLIAGGTSNYKADFKMNHIYFTALANGAGLAAALAKGDGPERVYVVEPTGDFEHDPNLTNHKFPGNLTQSYRSESPLKIVGEVTDWAKQPESIQDLRDRFANNQGEIIN